MRQDELLTTVRDLRARVVDLEQEKTDLEVLLDNTTEHSTDIEGELLDYVEQVRHVTAAAAAVEAAVFDPASLGGVAARTDELGQLARVFQRMANEIAAREQRLKSEVQQLRVEIDMVKQEQQVAEITETEYFRDLREKARTLRVQKTGRAEE